MINEIIDLYAYFNVDRNGVSGGYLTVYVRTESKEISKCSRPAMLVFPGGGYSFISDREGEPIALKFVEKGFSSFVLSYSVQTKYPIPLYEAEMAVLYIKEQFEKYNVDRQKICAIGFSSGGHLAGLLATIKENEVSPNRRIADVALDAVIFAYAVMSLEEFTDIETRDIITGGDINLRKQLSIMNRVDQNTAPAFVWSTLEDSAVPVENFLMLANSYRKNKVPFSLLIFENGYHGLSLADDEVCRFSQEEKNLRSVSKWVDLACDWLISRGIHRSRE